MCKSKRPSKKQPSSRLRQRQLCKIPLECTSKQPTQLEVPSKNQLLNLRAGDIVYRFSTYSGGFVVGKFVRASKRAGFWVVDGMRFSTQELRLQRGPRSHRIACKLSVPRVLRRQNAKSFGSCKMSQYQDNEI